MGLLSPGRTGHAAIPVVGDPSQQEVFEMWVFFFFMLNPDFTVRSSPVLPPPQHGDRRSWS